MQVILWIYSADLPHWDNTITFGNALTVFAFLFFATVAWAGVRSDIKSLKDHDSENDVWKQESTRSMVALQLLAERIVTLQDATDYRIKRLENENDGRRSRDAEPRRQNREPLR